MTVRTNRELYARVTSLGLRRDLETYLRALLALVRAHDPDEPGPDEVLRLLVAAASAEPAAFEPAWLTRTPDGLPSAGRARVEAILTAQIVDLRRMRDSGQLADDHRYFGLDAPGGARWYNFDLASYLECGVAGSVGGAGDDDEVELVTIDAPAPDEARVRFGWDGLCDLLRAGQSYE